MNKSNMKIQGKVLRESDIGSKVTYVPHHAHGNACHVDVEGGTISSWGDSFVFVNFGGGTNPAVTPDQLVWG
ncbi:hypothetical protein LCGC14_1733160 [marine sediment metagenome]|uniref:Uncharacterized protein n=1 Tax=marine sediment metagenome TaxID=412755 RepID=A0A0F9JPC6_9ZZZZ